MWCAFLSVFPSLTGACRMFITFSWGWRSPNAPPTSSLPSSCARVYRCGTFRVNGCFWRRPRKPFSGRSGYYRLRFCGGGFFGLGGGSGCSWSFPVGLFAQCEHASNRLVGASTAAADWSRTFVAKVVKDRADDQLSLEQAAFERRQPHQTGCPGQSTEGVTRVPACAQCARRLSKERHIPSVASLRLYGPVQTERSLKTLHKPLKAESAATECASTVG